MDCTNCDKIYSGMCATSCVLHIQEKREYYNSIAGVVSVHEVLTGANPDSDIDRRRLFSKLHTPEIVAAGHFSRSIVMGNQPRVPGARPGNDFRTGHFLNVNYHHLVTTPEYLCGNDPVWNLGGSSPPGIFDLSKYTGQRLWPVERYRSTYQVERTTAPSFDLFGVSLPSPDDTKNMPGLLRACSPPNNSIEELI